MKMAFYEPLKVWLKSEGYKALITPGRKQILIETRSLLELDDLEYKKEKKTGIISDLDFEIVEKIDNKKHGIVKLKVNKILVKIDAVALPKYVLKCIRAHLFIKRRTKIFWKVVVNLYSKRNGCNICGKI
jgi:hypothetical protein